MTKIIVGLSGGVDSFVTALLLQQQGFEVIGIHLRLWDAQVQPSQEESLNELCSRTGIKLYRIDGRKLFQDTVVTPFIRGYLSGVTPNPCAICNSFVKWELLRSFADELQVHHIATGHYVKILPHDKHYYVHKGVDPNKDQSYFLWGVREDILSRTLTPLGDYTKAEVKEYARQHDFRQMADKRESMSICFLEGSDYRDFIARQPGSAACFTPGIIMDNTGQIVGEHNGIGNYTIGQKRGIPLKDGRPQYVARINPLENRIIAGDKSSLDCTRLVVKDSHFICPEEIKANDIEVKVRGLGLNPQGYAQISSLPDNTLLVQLSSPAWAVAPGQPVAFYRDDRVIGGGILSEQQYQ